MLHPDAVRMILLGMAVWHILQGACLWDILCEQSENSVLMVTLPADGLLWYRKEMSTTFHLVHLYSTCTVFHDEHQLTHAYPPTHKQTLNTQTQGHA